MSRGRGRRDEAVAYMFVEECEHALLGLSTRGPRQVTCR
jgi:hypothetical protein